MGEAGTSKSLLFHEFKATIPATCKVLEASTLWQPRTQQDSERLANTPASIYKAPHCRAKEEVRPLEQPIRPRI
jgi:hypothetical protein